MRFALGRVFLHGVITGGWDCGSAITTAGVLWSQSRVFLVQRCAVGLKLHPKSKMLAISVFTSSLVSGIVMFQWNEALLGSTVNLFWESQPIPLPPSSFPPFSSSPFSPQMPFLNKLIWFSKMHIYTSIYIKYSDVIYFDHRWPLSKKKCRKGGHWSSDSEDYHKFKVNLVFEEATLNFFVWKTRNNCRASGGGVDAEGMVKRCTKPRCLGTKIISNHLTTSHRLRHLVRSCVADLLTLGGLRCFLLHPCRARQALAFPPHLLCWPPHSFRQASAVLLSPTRHPRHLAGSGSTDLGYCWCDKISGMGAAWTGVFEATVVGVGETVPRRYCGLSSHRQTWLRIPDDFLTLGGLHCFVASLPSVHWQASAFPPHLLCWLPTSSGIQSAVSLSLTRRLNSGLKDPGPAKEN